MVNLKWERGIIVDSDMIIKFKIDTGAEVSVIPASYLTRDHDLRQNKLILKGASGNNLKVIGYINAHMQYKNRKILQPVYLIKGLSSPLLSKEASVKLGIVKLIDTIDALGELKNMSHRINILESAIPSAIYTARIIPIPLRKLVEVELDRMLKVGVIERVDEHTPWISPMVVIKKPNGKIRICIDYNKLNRVVKREVGS